MINPFKASTVPSNLSLLDFCRKFAARTGDKLPMYNIVIALQAGLPKAEFEAFSARMDAASKLRSSQQLKALVEELEAASSEFIPTLHIHCEDEFLGPLIGPVVADVMEHQFVTSLADFCLANQFRLMDILDRVVVKRHESGCITFTFAPVAVEGKEEPAAPTGAPLH